MDFKSILTTCPYWGVGDNLVRQGLEGQIIGTLPVAAVHLGKAA
jgi:hypothetical protein